MSTTLDVVIAGDTVRIDAHITDYDGNDWNPTSHSIQLYDPDGTASGSALTSPTQTAQGYFNQTVTIPSSPSGRWKIRWKCISGSGETAKNSSEDIYFDVKL